MNKHLRALGAVFLVFLVLVALYLFLSDKKTESNTNITFVEQLQSEGVPEFSVDTIDGEKVEVKRSSGKIVIVNFWASWCTPCIEEIPSLIKLADHFKDDLLFIAVSNDNSLDDIRVFLKSFPNLKSTNIKIVWDRDQKLSKTYKVNRLPESFIVKRDGRLEKKVIGSISWYTEDSIAYIKGLINPEKN